MKDEGFIPSQSRFGKALHREHIIWNDPSPENRVCRQVHQDIRKFGIRLEWHCFKQILGVELAYCA